VRLLDRARRSPWPTVMAVGLILWLCAVQPATAAETSAVSASFQPGTLTIASGAARNTVLLLSDNKNTPVFNLHASFTADPGITVKSTAAPTGLAAGGSAIVDVTVTRAVYTSVSASVEAVLTYKTRSSSTTIDAASVAVLMVVTPIGSATMTGPIAVTSTLGTAQLVEYQSTDVFFTLTNQSEQPQNLDSAQLYFPQPLTVQLLSAGKAAPDVMNGTLSISTLGILEPGDTTIVHLRLTADRPVQPGDALIVLIVRATSRTDGSTSTAVSSQKVSLSVLGESGVLQVLGVPSLLFVPGIVLAVVLWALWTYVYPRRAFTVSPSGGIEGKVVMWVFALLPSLALPFIYPTITGWFGPSRDYRKAYGLDDILYVWGIAAIAAFIVWALGVVSRWVSLRFFIAQEHDAERQLLLKFARRLWHRNLMCRSATYDTQEQVIILGSRVGKTLVTPAIAYTNNALTNNELTKLARHISRSQPFRLWVFLWRRKTKVVLAYQPRTPLAGPALVDPAKLDNFTQDALIRSS
jgi:hypothetical protein